MLRHASAHHDKQRCPQHGYATVTTRGVSLTNDRPQLWQALVLTEFTLTPWLTVTDVGAVAEAIGIVKVCEIT